jgi:lysophospholipase L1-like esterase
MFTRSMKLLLLSLTLGAVAFAGTTLTPIRIEQCGKPPETKPDNIVLANEPEGGNASLVIDFDITGLKQAVTPMARLHLDDVTKISVKRSGQKNTGERGVVHAFMAGRGKPVGVVPVKAGGLVNPYLIDVTPAVNAALAAKQTTVHLEVRLEGKPLFYEVYAAPMAKASLEIAPDTNWTDDWQQRLAPIAGGGTVYRETCLPIAESRDTEVTLSLLYPAKKIVEVFSNATGTKLSEGRDWTLRDGKLVLPAGSHAPLQIESEFFASPLKEKDGSTKMIRSQIRLMEGTWYIERQIEVTYEPASRDWKWPAAISSPDSLPRLMKKLIAKEPVTMILFGDSIAAGGNASKFQGTWPWQPCFGELVARAVEKHYGGPITFLNHSRAGATSAWALTQVDSQVAWFKPDLAIIAYGMNDRADGRREMHRANIEKMIDIIRAASPDTECLVVTPMLNNPMQPTGLEPVKFLRDEALKIERPGIAFADITGTHLAIIEHKPYLDLSGNGANHPNDFLHRIYAQRILEVLLPR